MNHDSTKPALSQKIFSMDLDVETVSLYLLCCAVIDTGAAIYPDVYPPGGGPQVEEADETVPARHHNTETRIADGHAAFDGLDGHLLSP